MKIFNLTDIETPKLVQRGLMNQHIAVHDKLLAPGGFAELSPAAFARMQSSLQELVAIGVLALSAPTPEYQAAAAKRVAPEAAKPALVELREPPPAERANSRAEAAPTTKSSSKAK